MSTPKQVRYSRWRRLPGLHRITERKIPDHRTELQRLTLYVPGGLLDQAELLAARAGAESVQAYCEQLLRSAIEDQAARERQEHGPSHRAPFVSLDALESDSDYLAEWSATVSRQAQASLPGPDDDSSEPASASVAVETLIAETPARPESSLAVDDPRSTVLRHAALGPDDPSAVLPTLRRGEPISPTAADELLRALIELERELVGESALDRRLAYALHRLAFEGQVLLTDAWPGVAADQATVDVLRMVQEAVDRVLSGEDIRYYSREPEPGPSP